MFVVFLWFDFFFIGEENSILLPDLLPQNVIFRRVCKGPRLCGDDRLAEPEEDDEGFVLRKKKGADRMSVPLEMGFLKLISGVFGKGFVFEGGVEEVEGALGAPVLAEGEE